MFQNVRQWYQVSLLQWWQTYNVKNDTPQHFGWQASINHHIQVHTPLLQDFQRLCKRGCALTQPPDSESCTRGRVLALPLEPPKIMQECGVLSHSFRRLQRMRKSILQSWVPKWSPAVIWNNLGEATGTCHRKRTLPKIKQHTADSGERWTVEAMTPHS